MYKVLAVLMLAVASVCTGCSDLREPVKYGLMMPAKEVGDRAEFYRLVEAAAPEVNKALEEINSASSEPSAPETQSQKKQGQEQGRNSYEVAAALAVEALAVGQEALTRYEFYVRLALTGLDKESAEGRKTMHKIAEEFMAAQKKLDSAAREDNVDDKLEKAGKMLASLGELARRLDHAFHYLKDRPDATPEVKKVLGFFQDDLAEGMKVFVELNGFISAELAVLEANGQRSESKLSRFTSIAADFAGAFPGGDYVSTGARVVRGLQSRPVVVAPAGTFVGAHVNVAHFGSRCVNYRRICEPYHRVVRGCRTRGTGISVGVAVERHSGTSVGAHVSVRR